MELPNAFADYRKGITLAGFPKILTPSAHQRDAQVLGSLMYSARSAELRFFEEILIYPDQIELGCCFDTFMNKTVDR